jgi:MFS family permease
MAAAAHFGWLGVVLSFVLIGLGVSAAGTNVLVLLAKRVPEQRRAPAATVVWMMMIFGLAFTAVVAGKFLDPHTPARLVAVMASVCAAAWLLACLAINGLEERTAAQRRNSEPISGPEPQRPSFHQALAQVWTEPDARRFTIFIFVSMLAFRQLREGVRMGLRGAAQVMAFGPGGALGAGASDLARWLIGSLAAACSLVFAAEAAPFVLAAMLALKIGHSVAKATEATTPGTRPGVSSDSGSQGEPSLALGQPR